MDVQKIEINPDVIKDSGLFILNTDKITLPFKVKEKTIVYIPVHEFGGNHKHPRIEGFISLGNNLKLIWVDREGVRKEEMMKTSDKLFLYIIPPNIPHAVLNTSSTDFGVLVEFSDLEQHSVVKVELVNDL